MRNPLSSFTCLTSHPPATTYVSSFTCLTMLMLAVLTVEKCPSVVLRLMVSLSLTQVEELHQPRRHLYAAAATAVGGRRQLLYDHTIGGRCSPLLTYPTAMRRMGANPTVAAEMRATRAGYNGLRAGVNLPCWLLVGHGGLRPALPTPNTMTTTMEIVMPRLTRGMPVFLLHLHRGYPHAALMAPRQRSRLVLAPLKRLQRRRSCENSEVGRRSLQLAGGSPGAGNGCLAPAPLPCFMFPRYEGIRASTWCAGANGVVTPVLCGPHVV
jgi:hypothetical protein